MGLFVTRGFDHVTVGEIARAAGVSEKTVFNYFPTKEDIFFDEVPERLEALTETIRQRGSGQSLVEAMHEQFFRNARAHALAGRTGATAARRLRAELERAYRLLEHGLGGLDAGVSAG